MSEQDKIQKSETSCGLPVVTKSTVDGAFQSDKNGERKWGDRLEDTKKRMILEQPDLVKFIERQVGRFPEELHTGVLEIIVGTYSILEQQSNANRLSSSFGVSGETKK
jgi:hypothetical protein